MPFISQRDERTRLQSSSPFEDIPDPSFSETFGAAVGIVIDEELSISRNLNREGWVDRKTTVADLIAQGVVNQDDYQTRNGIFDYDRLARDLNRPDVKTNFQLEQERSAILKKRREYGQRILERGSGLAQFTGMAVGYMLDPINIAIMPLGTAAVSAKSLTTIGRAMTVARNEAALALVSETAIQSMVWEHKHDIDSPWTEADAITAIAFAAGGAALISGTATGIGGYIKKVRQGTQDVLAENPQLVTSDVEQSISYLERMEQALKNSPQVDTDAIEKQFIQDLKTRLTPGTDMQLSKSQRKTLNKTLQGLTKQVDEVSAEERLAIKEQIDAVELRLEQSRLGQDAEADLSRIEQGIIPDKYKAELEEVKQQALIDSDRKFLLELDNQRQVSGKPTRTPKTYEEPELDDFINLESKATTGTQKAVLEQSGLSKDYDLAMTKFDELDSPRVPDENGNLVDAKTVMKQLDDELEEIENIMVCTRE